MSISGKSRAKSPCVPADTFKKEISLTNDGLESNGQSELKKVPAGGAQALVDAKPQPQNVSQASSSDGKRAFPSFYNSKKGDAPPVPKPAAQTQEP